MPSRRRPVEGRKLKEGQNSRVVVEHFATGSDVLRELNKLVQREHILAGSLSAMGAVKEATVGFLREGGKYDEIALKEPLEVLSCIGNVSAKDGVPHVHAHIVLGDKEGKAHGGHLMPGCIVGATFEVVMQVFEGIMLKRKLDPSSGIFLLET
jgi:predicted DNA-binding protein with PD1-like motif